MQYNKKVLMSFSLYVTIHYVLLSDERKGHFILFAY